MDQQAWIDWLHAETAVPFADEMFELVINRHESYRPEEVCGS
ncbi:hypothetical protein A6764_04040 [Brevibacillus sp. WF146]|nr:hypothetical protein [Brevibacillus sp. WF146]UYZ14146.1 hypothetical protein A6764_04040 [Brevibacillus sp. WF146]